MFREHLVGTKLSYIADVFEGAGLTAVPLPEGTAIGGQRRTYVEEFYAGINWLDGTHERRLLAAYTHILKDVPQADRLPLLSALRGDGYDVDGGTCEIVNPRPLTLSTPSDIDDPDALAAYDRRIQAALQDDDPELAVGTAKELVEAVCKQLLADASVTPDTEWSLEKLYKEAAKTISLDVDSVGDARPGAESIKKVLRGLALVVSGTAELRNRFGTGHGRHLRSGLQARHAEFVAGCSLTVARFLLATRTERRRHGRSHSA